VVDALQALELPIFVAWWRQAMPPPDDPRLEALTRVSTRKLTCSSDFEEYWRQSGLLRHVRRARNRCKHLKFVVNAPGASEWTLSNWGRRWAQPGGELSDVQDRFVALRYWEPRNRQFTLALADDETIVAGASVFVHDRELVGQANYRNPDYDRLDVWTRLLDCVHCWACEQGFEKQDFGGGHEYKTKWAPEDGARWQFTIHPTPSHLQSFKMGLKRIVRSLGR
jgi:hypothetical protein